MSLFLADDPAAMDATAAVLDGGGLAVIPTETVYGLCARWDRPQAVASIFELKHRPLDKPLQVLVGEVEEALALGRFDEPSRQAARAGWPGPLTIVVPRSERSRAVHLGGEPATIGLRVPDHALAQRLLSLTGPLAATSANISGDPTAATVEEIREQLGDAVGAYVDAGPIQGRPSRVVSFLDGTTEIRPR